MREEERGPDEAVGTAAAHSGVAASVNAAAASKAVDDGWLAVKTMMEKEANKLAPQNPKCALIHPKQAAGNIFEALNDMRDNVRFSESGQLDTKSINARLNGDHPAIVKLAQDTGLGANRLPQDSLKIRGGKIVGGRQDKYLDFDGPRRAKNLKSVADDRYGGSEVAVAADKVATVRQGLRDLAAKEVDPAQKSAYLDAAERVREGVSTEDVGLAVKEGLRELAAKETDPVKRQALAEAAGPDSKSYIFRQSLKAYGKEMSVASGSAAVCGAVIGGTVSAIRNGISLRRGEVDGGACLRAVAADSGMSALRGGGQAALAVTIRTGAQKAGVAGLAKGAGPVALAGAFIDAGRVVYDLAKGRVEPDEAIEQLGETGCVAIAGLYVGAAATAAFKGAGVLPLAIGGIAIPVSVPVIVASTAACITVSLIYQSCLQVFKTARLEIEEAERVVALAAAAEAELVHQRRAFEEAWDAAFLRRQASFDSSFTALEEGLAHGDLERAVAGLLELAQEVGSGLKFGTFDEFKAAMAAPEPIKF